MAEKKKDTSPKDLIGKEIIITDNNLSSHGISIGSKVKVVKNTQTGWQNPKEHTQFTVVTRLGKQVNIYYGEFEVIINNVDALIAKAEKLKAELEEVQDKMDYMTRNKLDEFSEQEYQIDKTLNAIEDPNVDRHKRAEMIQELLKLQR